MSLNTDSKYYDQYYNHVSDDVKTEGTLGKVFDIIDDLSDRRGLRQEWEEIDGCIQDEIIEKWCDILNTNNVIQGKKRLFSECKEGDIFSLSSTFVIGEDEENYLNMIVKPSLTVDNIDAGNDYIYNVINLNKGRVRTFHPESIVYVYDKKDVLK